MDMQIHPRFHGWYNYLFMPMLIKLIHISKRPRDWFTASPPEIIFWGVLISMRVEPTIPSHQVTPSATICYEYRLAYYDQGCHNDEIPTVTTATITTSHDHFLWSRLQHKLQKHLLLLLPLMGSYWVLVLWEEDSTDNKKLTAALVHSKKWYFINLWTKWQPFCRRYFQVHFREWKVLYFY